MAENLASADDVPRANGMPMFGSGTWQNTNADECRNAVQTALEMGYWHIDTAQAYGNEAEVGKDIVAVDVDRDEVFLTTRVWADGLFHDNVIENTEASLEKLGVDYVDLPYVHWSSREYDTEETPVAFDELVERGPTERVGISNFGPEQVCKVVELSEPDVFANQIEMHPLFQQEELREVCAEEDIESIAYSLLARGEVFDVDVLSDTAEKHDASGAQVSLAWLREKGVTATPKATDEVHTRDNWESLALELNDEDVAAIDAIDTEDRRVDSDSAPW